MSGEGLLALVLALLAAYHLAMGALCLLAPRGAARLAGALYALRTDESPALRHGVRMLGLYALALGALLAVAALDPRGHAEVAWVLAGLQLARAIARLVWRRDLERIFGIPQRRNAISAVVLVVEAAVIAIGLSQLS